MSALSAPAHGLDPGLPTAGNESYHAPVGHYTGTDPFYTAAVDEPGRPLAGTRRRAALSAPDGRRWREGSRPLRGAQDAGDQLTRKRPWAPGQAGVEADSTGGGATTSTRSMKPILSVASSDFETALTVPAGTVGRYLAVQALDGAGHALGSSAGVQAGLR